MPTSRREIIAMTAATAATAAAPGAALAQAAPSRPVQSPGFRRWKVGDDVIVTAIHAGATPRNTEGFIRNAPLEAVRQAAAAAFLPTEAFPNHYTSLVVETGGRVVLLDAAFGDSGFPGSQIWAENFRAAGFGPARVDQVIVSHFHSDHINGIRLRDGALQFPNATISVPAAEWAFWMSDERMNAAPEAGRAGFQNARRVFAPLAGQVTRFEPGAEVARGIVAVPSYGHTPGHTSFTVASGQGRMMFGADAINHPAFFVRHPDWQPVFDMNPDQAVASRRGMLDMLAAERMLLSLYHAPFPGVGYVTKQGAGFDWTPLPYSATL